MYDGVGNQELVPQPKMPTVYDRTNELLSSQRFIYQYDANGNLSNKAKIQPGKADETEEAGDKLVAYEPDPDLEEPVDSKPEFDSQFRYTWDYENRLVKVVRITKKHQVSTDFKYDPFDRRIEKRVEVFNRASGKSKIKIHNYLYGQKNIAQEIVTKLKPKHDTVETTTFIHGSGMDEPLALSGSKGDYFFHADGLGSIVALTNLNGEVAQQYEYSPFGLRQKHDQGLDSPYSFTGREWDNESGLYYYRARYYDPHAGRFISKDPIGFASGDVNLYRYVRNNPVNSVDPKGLKPDDCDVCPDDQCTVWCACELRVCFCSQNKCGKVNILGVFTIDPPGSIYSFRVLSCNDFAIIPNNHNQY